MSAVRSTRTEVRASPMEVRPARARLGHVAPWMLPVFAYVGVAAFLPLSTSVPIIDELLFAESAWTFAETGQIVISDLSAPTAVFEAVWGGLFAKIAGTGFGALRLSSVVLVLLSVPFMARLLLNLGATRRAAQVGVAAYLFSPLALSLAFTFMTDTHAMALIVMAAALFTEALKARERWVGVLGAASLLGVVAFMSRQQALIVVLAGSVAWLVAPLERRRKWLGLALWALPTGFMAAVVAMTGMAGGGSTIRQMSITGAVSRNIGEVLGLATQTAITAPIYLGLFAVGLIPMILPSRHRLADWLKTRFGLSVALMALGLWIVTSARSWGPFELQTWITHSGLGGVDRSFLGTRPLLLPMGAWFLVGLVLSLAFVGFVAGSSEARVPPPQRVFAWIVISITALGVFVSSLPFQGWVFDRYWLPALPFVLALVLPGAARRPSRLAASWILVAAMGIVGVVGMRDAFVAYDTGYDYASEVVDAGIPVSELDGGASWAALTFGPSESEPERVANGSGPFWTRYSLAPEDPEFAIALHPIDQGEVLDDTEYESLLHNADTRFYLVKREPGESLFADPNNH